MSGFGWLPIFGNIVPSPLPSPGGLPFGGLEVAGKTLRFRRAVIATGARASTLPICGACGRTCAGASRRGARNAGMRGVCAGWRRFSTKQVSSFPVAGEKAAAYSEAKLSSLSPKDRHYARAQ
jgi:hypothetical protein